jgi:hypothetical protein
MFSGYLSCSLWYSSCLVIHVISISNVSIDVFFCVCEFLHVKSEKLAKTLSNIHIGDKPLQAIGSTMHLNLTPFNQMRVEVPTTDHLRNFAPYMEIYRVVQNSTV